MTGARLYREHFKPATIQYIEEHFQEFYNFIQNMSPEYVTYVINMSENYSEFVKNLTQEYIDFMRSMSAKIATYLEQTVPIIMNREETLASLGASATFISPGTPESVPVGLIDADFSNLSKAFLLIIGRAVNTFGGTNHLDCTTPTHNQWMINIDGAGYVDLQNGAKADGQMVDGDWRCEAGGIHPFTFMFDITALLTAVNNSIALRLEMARSLQNNLIVTIDVYMKVVWKL